MGASNVREGFENVEVYKELYLLPDNQYTRNSDGAWRLRIYSDDLKVDRKESGEWVEKGSFTK